MLGVVAVRVGSPELVLIVIGGVFLADNFGLEMPGHWWALVFLIPAVGALSRTASLYRSNGRRLDGPVVAALTRGPPVRPAHRGLPDRC